MNKHPKILSGKLGFANERGGVLIELGLIMPLIALLMVGATNIGLALSDRQVLIEAVRYGGRRAVDEGQVSCGKSVDRKTSGLHPIGVGQGGGTMVVLKPGGCAFDLAEGYPRTPFASQLAELFACELLQQSGLDLEKWRADAVEVGVSLDGTRAIYVQLTPAKDTDYFTSALMGRSFPSASAEFLIGDRCPTISSVAM